MKYTTAPLIIIFLLFVSTSLVAQKKEPLFKTSLLVGLNNTSYNENDSNRLDGLFQPFIGLMYEIEQSEKFSLLFSTGIFRKASRYVDGTNLVRTGIEFGFYPSLRFDDFSCYLGFQFNSFASQRFETKSNFTTPEELPELDRNGSFLPVIGLDIKLSNSLSLGFNQSLFLPSSKEDVNTQLLLRYCFGVKKSPQPPSYRKVKKRHSKQQIQELKDGVLLVRLKTSQPKIDALKRFGYEYKAMKVAKYQKEQNQAIVDAFKQNYSFSSVYFFYSYNTDKVKKGALKNIFLNDSLTLDSTIQIDTSKCIYTAELAHRQQDTFKLLDNYHTGVEGDFYETNDEVYYGGSDISFQAIIIKDQKFNQLTRPFPYYSRYVGESFKRHPEQVFLVGPIFFPIFTSYTFEQSIERLNKRLYKYYDKATAID